MNKITYAFKGLISEAVRNGDVASGVKCVWNVLFVLLKAIYFQFSPRPAQAPVPQSAVFKLEYKSKQRTSTLTK